MSDDHFTPPLRVKVAIVQLECHPAFKVGASDFISEPFIDNGPRPVLHTLWEFGFEIEELQTYCRDNYLVWHRSRLYSIIEWFGRLKPEDRPDLIVFPEGSIPRQFLPCLRDRFAEAFMDGKDEKGAKGPSGKKIVGTTIFAGTHAYEISDVARREYLDLGVDEDRLIELTKHQSEAPAVMPVIHCNGDVELFPKLAPSPFERTTIGRPTSGTGDKDRDVIKVMTKHNQERVIPVMAFVCSEALQFTGTNQPNAPELAVILSYDAKPQQFEALALHLVANRVSVAYCNDGRFGASRIFTQNDSRSENWLEQPPRSGRLPKGDAILVSELTVGDFSPQVGTSKPIMPNTLIRVSAVVPENTNEPSFVFSNALGQNREVVKRATEKGEAIDINGIRDELQFLADSTGATPIQDMQLSRLLSLARNNTVLLSEWDTFADDCHVGTDCYQKSIWVLNRYNKIDSATFPVKSQRSTEVPPSLATLRSALAAHCYRRVSLLLDSLDIGDPSALLEARRRLAEFAPKSLTGSAIASLVNQVNRIKNDSRRVAKMRLSNALSALVEKFACTSGMLFIVQRDHRDRSKNVRLVASVLLNTPQREIERFAAEYGQGIVGFVGHSKCPYLCSFVGCDPDVSELIKDPYYLSTISSTRSELAVPIFASGTTGTDDELIGVLNLESRQPGGFTEVDVGYVQNASSRLLTDIRVLQSASELRNSIAVHPAIHGWSLTRIIEKLCHELATSFSGGERAPSISATIWNHDSCKRRLYVIGTSRYDFEYMADKSLSEDTFLGSCLGNEGQVFRGSIDDLPNFRKRKKAEQMELTRVAVCPFNVETLHGNSRFLLALYSFRHDHGLNETNFDSHFTDARIRRMAKIFGEVISDVLEQRMQLTLAGCREVISNGFDSLEVCLGSIRALLTESFDADAGSLFIRKGELLAATDTTGLESGEYSYSIKSTPTIVDDAKEGESTQLIGFTEFLSKQPNRTLRKIDIPDPLEICCNDNKQFSILPQNTVREKGAASSSSHRGFLGGSFGSEQICTGVFRLLRKENAPPFSEFDELVLRETCRYVSGIVGKHDSGQSDYINDSLIQVFPPVGEDWVRGWLQRLQRHVELAVGGQVALSHLRYALKDSTLEWKLRILACHSKFSKSIAADKYDFPLKRGNLGWSSIDWTLNQSRLGTDPRILFFRADKCDVFDCGGIERQENTKSGLCIPLRWMMFGNPVHGVLTVDFPFEVDIGDQLLRNVLLKSLEIHLLGTRNDDRLFAKPTRGISTINEFLSAVSSALKDHSIETVNLPPEGAWVDASVVSQTNRPISSKRLRWDLRFESLERQLRMDLRFNANDPEQLSFALNFGAFPIARLYGTIRTEIRDLLLKEAKKKLDLIDPKTKCRLIEEHGVSIEFLFYRQEVCRICQFVNDLWTQFVVGAKLRLEKQSFGFLADETKEGITAYHPILEGVLETITDR